jgi:hypothetical protein
VREANFRFFVIDWSSDARMLSTCQVLSFTRALFRSSLSLRCGAKVAAHGSLLAHALARARGFASAGLKHPSRTSRRAPARSRTPWRAQPFTMCVNMGKVRGNQPDRSGLIGAVARLAVLAHRRSVIGSRVTKPP